VNVWQYQQKAEPVFVPAGETVTLDKWFGGFPGPVKRSIGIASFAFIFAPVMSLPSAVPPCDWQQPTNQLPARVPPRIQGGSFAPTFTPATVSTLLLDWAQPTNQPVVQPARNRQKPYLMGSLAGGPPEVVTVDKWVQPTNRPIRWVVPTRHIQNVISPLPIPSAVQSLDKWYQPPPNAKPPPKWTPQNSSIQPVFPQKIFLDWVQPISQPVKFPRGNQQGSFVYILPIQNPAKTDWFQPTNQPVQRANRPTFGQYISASLSGGTPEDVTLEKWFQPGPNPVRIQARSAIDTSVYVSPVVIPPPVLLDWLQPVNQPVTRATRNPTPGGSVGSPLPLPSAIPVFSWWQQQTQPVFRPPFLYGKQYLSAFYLDTNPPPGVVNLDKWAQPTNQPIQRIAPRAAIGSSVYLLPIQNPVSAAIFQPTNQPYPRIKLGPAIGTYVVDTFPHPNIPISTDWFQPIQQPYPRQKPTPIQGGSVQNLDPIQNAVAPDWIQPIQQPYPATKRGPAVGISLVEIFPIPTPAPSSDWIPPTQQPIQRIPPRAAVGYFAFNPLPLPSPVPSLASWNQPIQQPYPRTRPRPAVGMVAFWVFPLPPPPAPFDWTQPTARPVIFPAKMVQAGGGILVEFSTPAEAEVGCPIFLLGLS
jgi:hypothetical protein